MNSQSVQKGERNARSSLRSMIAFALAACALGAMLVMFGALVFYDITNTTGPMWVLIAINRAPMFSLFIGVAAFVLAYPWQSRRELTTAAISAVAVLIAYTAPALANRIFALIP